MSDFFKWLTDEKLFIVSIGIIGIIAAAMGSWYSAGLVITGGVGYLKGFNDATKGETKNGTNT